MIDFISFPSFSRQPNEERGKQIDRRKQEYTSRDLALSDESFETISCTSLEVTIAAFGAPKAMRDGIAECPSGVWLARKGGKMVGGFGLFHSFTRHGR
ncbi:hypothetical protein SLA2020_365540 [Shorea laevis]